VNHRFTICTTHHYRKTIGWLTCCDRDLPRRRKKHRLLGGCKPQRPQSRQESKCKQARREKVSRPDHAPTPTRISSRRCQLGHLYRLFWTVPAHVRPAPRARKARRIGSLPLQVRSCIEALAELRCSNLGYHPGTSRHSRPPRQRPQYRCSSHPQGTLEVIRTDGRMVGLSVSSEVARRPPVPGRRSASVEPGTAERSACGVVC
jgi:hypothetical protein